ncbi:acetyltransferase [Carnobacterium sp. TMP28]|uniref:acetyltransferase n=1 Tax=Carnobacterium sp. TMP28 TaxID=3397060 RepID=UPI0039DF55E7
MKKLLLIGGGGHCKSIIDSLNQSTEYDIIGILDTPNKLGTLISGIKVIGVDSEMQSWFDKGIEFAFIALGSTGDTQLRQKLYEKAYLIGFKFPIINDPTALISANARIGEGTFIGKGTIINTAVQIGKNAIINSGAIVEHDSTIGDYCHLAPGATLSGNVSIGNHTHVGTNATVIQGIEIGEQSIIGAGSVVIRKIRSGSVAYGNPCKEAERE